jgi:hypothetical protein
MRWIGVLVLVGVIALTGQARGGDGLSEELQTLKAKRDAIKHAPSLMRWRDIPWLTDLNEGLEVAKKEQRPIFLWVSGDEPLGRC